MISLELVQRIIGRLIDNSNLDPVSFVPLKSVVTSAFSLCSALQCRDIAKCYPSKIIIITIIIILIIILLRIIITTTTTTATTMII